jgi:hypothetical protein
MRVLTTIDIMVLAVVIVCLITALAWWLRAAMVTHKQDTQSDDYDCSVN